MVEIEMEAAPTDVVKSDKRLGGSGVLLFGGTLFNNEDYNADLRGQTGSETYEAMRRSDPDVASGLSKITMPLLSASWAIEPVDGDSDEEREIAEFCEKWVMGRGRLDPFAPSWQDTLRHALLMLSDGFSAFEKVWGTDEEGRQVYSQFGSILPKSVSEFQFRKDGSGSLDFMRQRCFTADRGFVTADIPGEKLLLFTFGREGDNLWGWPILRAAYKPWYLKKTLEIIDGIRHERHGVGFAVIKIPAGATNEQKSYAEKVSREMRVHDRQGVVIEDDMELTILYPTGTGTDLVASMQFLKAQILQVLLSEFMEHGSSNVGSKALVSSKIDLMMLTLQGVASSICEVFNRQAIVPLVYRNWGPREKYPVLKCEDMDKMGGTELAEILSKLATAELVHPRADLEQHLLTTLKLPEIPEDELKRMKEADEKALDLRINPPEPVLAPGFGGDPKVPAGEGQPPKVEKPKPEPPAKEAREPVPAALAAFRREPFAHEAHMQFSEIRSYLDDEPKRVWHNVVVPFRKRIIEGLAREAAAAPKIALQRGRIGDSIEKRMERAASNERRLSAALADALVAASARGKSDVVAELKRQATRKLAEGEDDYEAEEVSAPQKASAKDFAESFVVASTLALMVEAIRVALQVRRSPSTSNETIERRVATALEGMSEPRQQADLGGRIAGSYTTGRREQATALASEIDTYRYTAILDDATCEPCNSRDGAEHDGGDSNYETPSPFCDWPDNCRCFDVYIAKQEAA